MRPGSVAMGLALGRWAGMADRDILHGPWAAVLEQAWAKGVLEGHTYVLAGPSPKEKLHNLMQRPWQPR